MIVMKQWNNLFYSQQYKLTARKSTKPTEMIVYTKPEDPLWTKHGAQTPENHLKEQSRIEK